MNWLILALLAFSISSLVSFLLSKKITSKKSKICRLGGIAIISSFVMAFLFSEIVIASEWQAVLIGSLLILVFGLLDDFRNLNWKKQIAFQISLALILIWFGFEVGGVTFAGNELFRLDFWQLEILNKTFSIISSLFVVFWLMILINAVNWLDGSDGLLSVAGILSLLAVFGVSLRPEVNQPALAIISVIGIGSLCGFLIFNFPKAKIEAGTSGSYFIGFLLASLAIIAGTKISTTMVILILPVTDFIWVIIERFKAGQSVFQRDDKKRHLHYKLLEKGFSPRQILLGYTIFLGLALLISFFVVNQFQKIILLAVELLMILVLMLKLADKLSIKKMKIKKIVSNPIIFIILIIGFLIGVNLWQKQTKNKIFFTDAEITINSTDFKVKLAETSEETYQGLSGQEKIPPKMGMLFLYDHDSPCYHVMRGMLFDLDFVFLKDGKVVSIEENIPKDFKGVIQAETACNQVLEINAGEVEDLKIEVGNEMRIK